MTKTKKVSKAVTPPIGAMPDQWPATRAFEALSDIGSEYMEFLAERVREDVRVQHALLHCKDVDGLRKIQESFLRTAADQYSAQAGRMTALTNEFLTALMLPRIDEAA